MNTNAENDLVMSMIRFFFNIIYTSSLDVGIFLFTKFRVLPHFYLIFENVYFIVDLARYAGGIKYAVLMNTCNQINENMDFIETVAQIRGREITSN